MQLLPIIIVVSLLCFFVALTILIFVYIHLRTREQRKRQQQNDGDSQRPPRQLTVRSGRVVPISKASRNPSTRDIESLDLSSQRSSKSVKSKATQGRAPRLIHQVQSSDRRRSSAIANLEAQEKESEKRWEEGMKAFPLEERIVPSQHTVNLPGYNRSTSLPNASPSTISGQKIADSLQRAYNGAPTLNREPLQAPASPLSRPSATSASSHKRIDDTSVTRRSRFNTDEGQSRDAELGGKLRKQESEIIGRGHISETPKSSSALVPDAIQVPLPALLMDNQSSQAHNKLPDYCTPFSFFSVSDSQASSISQNTNSMINAPPPSPTSTPGSQRSSQSITAPRRTLSAENRQTRPPNIDTNVPNMTDTSFLDSADSSAKTRSGLERGISVLSNDSVLTFASSTVSSTWTIGNARPIAIVASVAPRTLTMHPKLMGPRSKYRRRLKSMKEKALPILPSSPLRE